MTDTPYKATPEIHEWPKESQPVVFMYPPAEYEVLTPDRFPEWEQKLHELTGLQVKTGTVQSLPTLSYCGPGESNYCDSDQL